MRGPGPKWRAKHRTWPESRSGSPKSRLDWAPGQPGARSMTEIACVVEAHDALGECCLWCPTTRRVWWLDIQKPCLQSYDPVSREHRVYPLPGKHCGCAALRKSGGFVLALDNGLHGFDPATGKLELLVHAEPDEPGNRYNDGRCDRRGRLWIGTMDIDIRRAVRQLLPDRRRPLGAAPVRRHHGAELDRLLARRPHALFRRHAAPRDLGVRFRPRRRRDRRTAACSRTSPRARAFPTAPASTPKAFSGTPNTPATG